MTRRASGSKAKSKFLKMSDAKLGLYIHSPFCVHKCSYCDFNSWAETRREPQLAWLTALEKQIQYWSAQLADRVTIDTIFWGGGTPSLMDNDLIIRTGELLRKHFFWDPAVEFTVEVNPETVTEAKLAAIQGAGAGRISMGIQSFQDNYLDKLERHARAKDNHRALENVAQFWPLRWSMDLMFGLPDQTLVDWEGELAQALAYRPDHISAYQLTLTTSRAKNWRQPDEESLLAFFDRAEVLLGRAGLDRYEVSNFARSGQESRHNLRYWEMRPFLGMGPGAAGLLPGSLAKTGEAVTRFGYHQKQPDNFDLWVKGAGDQACEQQNLASRSAQDHAQEMLMMGLRLKKGVARERLGPASLKALSRQQDIGFIEEKGGFYRCRPEGYRILDTLLSEVFKIMDEEWVKDLDSVQSDPRFR